MMISGCEARISQDKSHMDLSSDFVGEGKYKSLLKTDTLVQEDYGLVVQSTQDTVTVSTAQWALPSSGWGSAIRRIEHRQPEGNCTDLDELKDMHGNVVINDSQLVKKDGSYHVEICPYTYFVNQIVVEVKNNTAEYPMSIRCMDGAEIVGPGAEGWTIGFHFKNMMNQNKGYASIQDCVIKNFFRAVSAGDEIFTQPLKDFKALNNTIMNSTHAIWTTALRYNISDNYITDPFGLLSTAGIIQGLVGWNDFAGEKIISNNMIFGYDRGIIAGSGTINRNHIEAARFGIYTPPLTADIMVENNEIHSLQDGIYFQTRKHPQKAFDHAFIDNFVSGEDNGFIIKDYGGEGLDSPLELNDSTISGSTAVQVLNTANVTNSRHEIINNDLLAETYGISIESGNDNLVITGNAILTPNIAIYCKSSNSISWECNSCAESKIIESDDCQPTAMCQACQEK
ncbi:hypothetical protein JW868_02535 [Candidatus Woesearchaeota archaeon]|nr:hypothetical protein [Candidatus Woesearchaeota archaeon]